MNFVLNLENDNWWNSRRTTISPRYSDKYLLQNFKKIMLSNSVFVDMKVYALQLKQKYTAGVFHGILQNFRPATF